VFGGAPRELSAEIQDADWTADGKQLAVIRHTRIGHLIEAPLGNPILESQNWISNLRMSPRGDRLAFLDHELWGDSTGRVVIIDLRGQRIAESKRWNSTSGLAWTPGGDEVWTSSEEGARSAWDLRALSLTGKERTVLPAPGFLTLHDIGRDGRALFGMENARREIIVGRRGDERERNVSWLDWSFLAGLSPDGSRIVFEEQIGGRREEANGVYVRNVDGSPAVRLGEGAGRSFSPDGASIAIRPPGADFLEIVPIGVGTSRRVPLGNLEIVWWSSTPDGKQMIVWGHQAGGASRHFAIAIDGSAPPRPITPEGSKVLFAIAPDSARLLTQMADDRLVIVPFDGSDQQPVPGAEAGDRPLQWSADGGSIFVYKPGRVEVSIDRIELSSGARSHWQLLRPDDPAGIMDIFPIVMTRDGANYAYSYRRFMSDLYVVEGLV